MQLRVASGPCSITRFTIDHAYEVLVSQLGIKSSLCVHLLKGAQWFGANTCLNLHTAAQSEAAFSHLHVEDEIWRWNGGGQRSDGGYDLVIIQF
ncbi:hypothetical protein Bca4012_020832 [Brassica carinata]